MLDLTLSLPAANIVIFTYSLDPDQDNQTVGPDLD